MASESRNNPTRESHDSASRRGDAVLQEAANLILRAVNMISQPTPVTGPIGQGGNHSGMETTERSTDEPPLNERSVRDRSRMPPAAVSQRVGRGMETTEQSTDELLLSERSIRDQSRMQPATVRVGRCSSSFGMDTQNVNESLPHSSQCYSANSNTHSGDHDWYSRGIKDHKRLFSFNPSLQYNRKGKGPAAGYRKPPSKKARITYWKKNSLCLANSQQTIKPTPHEKITLAKMGLTARVLVFEAEGSAHHVHNVILKEYPMLESSGGYTLLRLAENSYNLVEIEEPMDGVITVEYLKEILKNAILYIRPLQRNIIYEDVKQYIHIEASDDEPSEFCHNCRELFTLSDLRKHIIMCKQENLVSGRSSTREVGMSKDSNTDCSPDSPTAESFGPHVGSPSKSPSLTLENDHELEEWESDVVFQQYLEDSLTQQENTASLSSDSHQPALEVSPMKTIGEAISEHKNTLNDETFRIIVRRAHVFEDTLAVLEKGIKETGNFQVKFLGEIGIDEGGLKREFFRLLLKAVATNNTLLIGPPNRRVLRHNAIAFQDKIYEHIGKIIALSILHGGPGPSFFATPIVDYLFGGMSAVKASIKDIPDDKLRLKVTELDGSTIEQFDALLSSKELKDIWKTCGFMKPIDTMDFNSKKKVIDVIVLHVTIGNSLAELEQLRHGLSFLKFDSLMKNHTDLVKSAFRPSTNPITARYLQDIFTPLLSPSGSVKRTAEEAILMSWFQYLEDVEAIGEERSPNLKDVMTFLTGSDVIPPLGFDVEPTIVFTDEQSYPTVSTCSLTLTFSRSLNANFPEMMDIAVGETAFDCL